MYKTEIDNPCRRCLCTAHLFAYLSTSSIFILGKGCPSRQGKSKILLLLLLYLYFLVSFEEFISFRFSFQLLLVLHSHFNVTTVPKATHSQTRAFREDLRPVTLGDSVLQMTPSYASSGVAIKGHVT